MANKEFKIQSDTVSLNGVALSSSVDGRVVIPGVTRATGYQVDKVEDNGEVSGGSLNPSNVMVIDNAQFLFYSGSETSSAGYVAAQYIVELDEDGLPDGIEVDVAGTFAEADKTLALSSDMWFTDVPNATDNFSAGDWSQYAFRPKFQASAIESEFGGGSGDTGNITFDGNTISSEEGYPLLVNAPEAAADDGGVEIDFDSDTVSHAMWLNGEDGLAIQINRHLEEGESRWSFSTDGALTFPDGSKQSTAYTGGSVQYVLANDDGNIITSTDGTTWSDPTPSGLSNGIDRLDINGGIIVYIDTNGNLFHSSQIGTVTQATGTDSLGTGSVLNWREVEYFPDASLWVAVGNETITGDGTIIIPALAYSSNGLTWTIKQIDSEYRTSFNTGGIDWTFTDVTYDNNENVFVISSNMDVSNAGGIFVISDLTTTALDTNTHVTIEANFSNIGFFSNPFFTAPGSSFFFAAAITSGNQELWTCAGSASVGSNWNNDATWLYDSFLGELGITFNEVAEFAVLNQVAVITTSEGQVWVQPNAPTTNVSVPLPYTSPITDIVRGLATGDVTTITLGNGTGPVNDGEKITISGVTSETEGGETTEQSYNGEYYIKNNSGSLELYTDQACTTPWDTTTYWPVTQPTNGTLTWSHGQYIDALGIVGQILYAGNDDEQVFKSTNWGSSWTQVADQNNNGEYLNDFAYGLIGGGSSLSTGDVTFTNNIVQGTGYELAISPGSQFTDGSYTAAPGPELGPQYFRFRGGDNYEHLHFDTSDNSLFDLYLGDDTKYVKLSKDGPVVLGTNSLSWSFNTDGSVSLPLLNVNLHNGGIQQAQLLQFGVAGSQVVITGPTPDTNTDAERIIIQGQRSSGSGEGGDVYLWGGDSDYNGGDIKIYAGDADAGDGGSGGYVNIDGGNGFSGGGTVSITGGGSSGGSGGNVQIAAGNGIANGSIILQTYGNTWTLTPEGTITLPSGGDIKNSSGTSVLGGMPIGETVIELDGTLGVAAPYDVSIVYSLLFIKPAIGYVSGDAFTITLPSGQLGQRLTVVNAATLCTCTISNVGITGTVIGGNCVAEFVYTSEDGWYVLSNTTV